MSVNERTDVKSAVRVLELLELLARSERPMSFKMIVDETGYPKSSTFNLLATLVSRGYVVRDDLDSYRLHEAFRNGPGWVNGHEAAMIAKAMPIMEALRDSTEETIFLGTLRRDGRLKRVAKLPSRQAVRFDSPLTASDPSYCTAMGRVLLAHWTPKRSAAYLSSERLISITPHTVVDKAQIREIIEDVRRNGYAISNEEAVLGGCGIAAPVRDASGRVVAALDIATVTARFAASRDALIAAVMAAADDLSARLHYRNC